MSNLKISVVFPNVMYREGPAAVQQLIQAIEAIGYDELAMFDHVVMGYPTAERPAPFYSPKMPIVEALTMLSYAAASTESIGLATGVLVLPQRQVTLVAKQVSTLDTLSGGRVRLGVGLGWQRSEYESLQQSFGNRGRRMDEEIQMLRAYWRDEHVNFSGEYHTIDDMAMEPKPPSGGDIPIWIGGTKRRALERVVAHGDGWMAMKAPGDPPLEQQMQTLHELADAVGRDPASIGMQMSLSPGALNKEQRKRFYGDPQLIRQRTIELRDLGFEWVMLDCVPIFQHGYRSVDAMVDYLAELHAVLKPELA